MILHPVARILRLLADKVDQGRIDRLEVKWSGDTDVEIECNVDDLLQELVGEGKIVLN